MRMVKGEIGGQGEQCRRRTVLKKKWKNRGEMFPQKNTKSKQLQNKVVEFFVLRIKTRAGTTSDRESIEDR
jgi:hypothetical protein